MFQDALIKLDQLESETLLEDINPVFGGAKFEPRSVTILGQELSFYRGYRFLDIADYESVPPKRKFVIYNPKNIVLLDWTNEPIYKLNKEAPIYLDEYNVADYVRFFFGYVRGRHGRFVISENIDDIIWREEPPPAARKAIGKLLVPVSVDAVCPDGSYELTACMMFKDSLFKSQITVQKDGMVELSGEELLIEDMPVLDDTFGQ